VTSPRDPRRLAGLVFAVALAVGGAATLVAGVWLALFTAEAAPSQRVAVAFVPAVTGSAALWGARRAWRAVRGAPFSERRGSP